MYATSKRHWDSSTYFHSLVTNNLDVLSKAKDPFRLALPYVEMLWLWSFSPYYGIPNNRNYKYRGLNQKKGQGTSAPTSTPTTFQCFEAVWRRRRLTTHPPSSLLRHMPQTENAAGGCLTHVSMVKPNGFVNRVPPMTVDYHHFPSKKIDILGYITCLEKPFIT